MPASWATSRRRKPGVLRRGPATMPTSAGRMRSRQRRRNVASSTRDTVVMNSSLPPGDQADHRTADTRFSGSIVTGREGGDGGDVTTEKKIILVTGGNKGIGLATVRACAR